MLSWSPRRFVSALSRGILALVAVTALTPAGVDGQSVRIQDLTVSRHDVPVRLVGYGLVVGLEGSGDRVTGGVGAGHTVRSVANLLRRFDVQVPEQMLRTRNVAAVLVTAEVSPYLRPGGRFEIHVSSVGDAASLRGGVLWMTPLVASPGGPALATAQGSLLLGEGGGETRSRRFGVETTGRVPRGGVLQGRLGTPAFGQDPLLLLREPDLGTATRIATAVNGSFGEGTAVVQDPGAVALTLPADAEADAAATLAAIGDLTVTPRQESRVIIDGRDGTLVAGGEIEVGPAVVSHGFLTLTIGDAREPSDIQGDVRMSSGSTVQDVAAALHGVGAPASAVASVFESLESVGALRARVLIR